MQIEIKSISRQRFFLNVIKSIYNMLIRQCICVFVPVNIHGLETHLDGTKILSTGNSNFRRTINNNTL